MSISRKITEGAGSGGGSGGYVDDVFSTYVWEGTGADQDIINGVDLDGEGGMVWVKQRTGGAVSHSLYDTERGATQVLMSNSNSSEYALDTGLKSFNSDGFTHGTHMGTEDIASWTFRKAPSFFDVVTYTGDDVQGREIPHNLGVAPGMVIVKRLTCGDNWQVFHKDLSNPLTKMLYLNSELA